MQNNINNKNLSSSLLYAMSGVLLFISSMTFVLGYGAAVAVSEFSYTAVAFVLFASSISFLAKGIKIDSYRLSQYN